MRPPFSRIRMLPTLPPLDTRRLDPDDDGEQRGPGGGSAKASGMKLAPLCSRILVSAPRMEN